jgi:hypothetical protein
MDSSTSYVEFEQQPDIPTQKPLSEILLNSDEFREFWPEDQASSELYDQIDGHQQSVETVNQTMDALDVLSILRRLTEQALFIMKHIAV